MHNLYHIINVLVLIVRGSGLLSNVFQNSQLINLSGLSVSKKNYVHAIVKIPNYYSRDSTLMMNVPGDSASFTINEFIANLDSSSNIIFDDVMAFINSNFKYSPKRFTVGLINNAAGTNEGSCKIFSFGKFYNLDDETTLKCFGEHYRGVLADPLGESHQNIRNFQRFGWDGVLFEDGLALRPLQSIND